MSSPYKLIHALLATAALLALIFSQGFGRFWHQFVHGLNQVMTPEVLQQNLLLSSGLFGTLLLAFWLSTKLVRTRENRVPARPKTEQSSGGQSPLRANSGGQSPLRAMRLAALWAPAITVVALALNWLGAHAIEWCTQVKPSDQELVKCFLDGHYSLFLRVLLILVVLVQAPLFEEPLFRGIIFRGFLSSLPTGAAYLLSGCIFALAHVNAASFVALVFLGVAFAHLYRRTGTLLAPMTAHFLFNAANLILLFLCPDLASNS